MSKIRFLIMLMWIPFFVIGVLGGAQIIPWYAVMISLFILVIIFGIVVFDVEFESNREGVALGKAEIRWSLLPHRAPKQLVDEVKEISKEIEEEKL